MTTLELAPFDYAALPAETRVVVQQKTGEIRERMRRMADDIRAIGERLIEVRTQLPAGTFVAWLRAEFDWSQATAYRYIQVAEQFSGAPVYQIDKLAPAALYALAAPSTPEEARQEALERAEQGERITHQAAKALIATHAPPPAPSVDRAGIPAPVLARLEAVGGQVLGRDPDTRNGKPRWSVSFPAGPGKRRIYADCTVARIEELLIEIAPAVPPAVLSSEPSRVNELALQAQAERLPEPAPKPGYYIPAPASVYDEDAFEQVAILVDDLSDAMQAGDRGAAVRTWLAVGEVLTHEAFSAEAFAAWAAHWSPSKPTTPESMLMEGLRAALCDEWESEKRTAA